MILHSEGREELQNQEFLHYRYFQNNFNFWRKLSIGSSIYLTLWRQKSFQPCVLMNIQLCHKTLQEEEKDPLSLSSQKSGSVGFPRNKPMLLENFSWKVSCSRKCSHQSTLCLSSPLAPPGLSVTTCCCHSPWTICCAHCHMWDLGILLLPQWWTSTLRSLLAAQ